MALVLHSTRPDADAEFLRSIGAVPDLDPARGGAAGPPIGDAASVTQVDFHGVAVFLVPSSSTGGGPPGGAVCGLPDEDRLRALAERALPDGARPLLRLHPAAPGEPWRLGELALPSGLRLLLAAPPALRSPRGRGAVADWLRRVTVSDGTRDGAVRVPGRTVTANDGDDGGGAGPAPEDASPLASPPPRLPRFRTLQASLMGLHRGPTEPVFAFNARDPVDFETELFRGKLLCLLRPEDPAAEDPYWNHRVFGAKKRRLVLNIQGQFKHRPTGLVYAGAEISKPMRLGYITRALAGVLLRLVDRFISGVHSSFGDDGELAHIVAPAFGFFERVVVTPPGKEPPRIDEDIEESAESRAFRRNANSSGMWNTVDTYTFSFYSMNIDLPTWSLVGLPVSGDVSLTNFWGDSSLKICMYEKLGSHRQHSIDAKRYVFALNIEYSHGATGAAETDEGEEEDILRWSGRDLDVPAIATATAKIRRSESQVFDELTEDIGYQSDSDSLFFDAEQPKPGVDMADLQRIPSQRMDILSGIDGACPAWVEIISSRGGYTTALAVNMNGSTMLRSIDDCNELLTDSAATVLVERLFSSRLSSMERLRRMVGWVVMSPEDARTTAGKLAVFRQRRRIFSNHFCHDGAPTMSEKGKAQVKISGFVFRAVSDRHWIQEWIRLTPRSISLYHPDRRKSIHHVHLSNIIEVLRLPAPDCPIFYGQFFLVIRTSGRSLYLMFGSERDRERFREVTLNQMVIEGGTTELTASVDSESTSGWRLTQIDNPADEFLHRSSMWNCRKRRLLNSGRFNFRHSSSSPDPLRLVKEALSEALDPVSEVMDETEHRRVFLDKAAALKAADIHDLNEESKLAFFLNLYHLMIMHAYLVLGPPDWSLKWISYFNNIAYEVSDDIFSLAELEHCIIRNKMSNPSQFMSRFVIPKSKYNMALSTIDFRVNFALNCGSLSNPPGILVYGADGLEGQLETASRLSLASVSIIRKGGRKIVVELPRVCEWFLDDFGGSEESLLRRIEPYLLGDARRELEMCRSRETGSYDMNLIMVRYQAYSFECRPLQLFIS